MADPRFDRDDEPMPAWQGTSALVSAGIHGAAFAACVLIAAMPPDVKLDAAAMVEIARIELSPREQQPLFEDEPVPADLIGGQLLNGLHFDLPKIAARHQSLFLFLTGDLGFLDRLPGEVRDASAHVVNPLAADRSRRPVLSMSGGAMDRVVDRAWSRRGRWRHFSEIAEILMRHDGARGDAAALARAHVDRNLLQPFCDGATRDSRFWGLLENASDHADFIAFIRDYMKQSPSSPTTTELLFLLDELAQASRDALLTVLDTNVATDLVHSAISFPPALRLAADISAYYRGRLSELQLTSAADVRRAFGTFRLRVLSTIIETTPEGYRESDARFLAGAILFERGDHDAGFAFWSEMRPRAADVYGDAAAQIAAAMQTELPNRDRRLRTIVVGEMGKWNVQAFERLKHFGYRCDSY